MLKVGRTALIAMHGSSTPTSVALFGSFDDNQPIQDPYYGGIVRSTSFWIRYGAIA